MDFSSEIISLLKQRNYKQIGDKFYLPNSSNRPDRKARSHSIGNIAGLPAPLDSLAKKYWESIKLLEAAANLMEVSTLQPILNLSREFFKYPL